MSKIYIQKKNTKKKILKHLDITLPPELQKFIDCDIIYENYDSWYKIIISIDLEVFSNIVSNPYKLSEKKVLFELFSRCFMRQSHNYSIHLGINIKEDLTTTRYSHQSIKIKNTAKLNLSDLNISKWILYREKRARERYYIYEDTFKLDKYIIKLKSGEIEENILEERPSIYMKGGIIVDKSDCFWIKNFIETLVKCSRKYTNPSVINKFTTKSTLIICKNYMCSYWYNQILDNDKNQKIIKISSKSEHNNVTYNDILKSNFVIISVDYIRSKNYKNIWANYAINDTISLDDIYRVLYKDNINNIKFKNNKLPIMSLFHWKRLVIDNITFSYYKNSDFINNIIRSISSSYRWLNVLDTELNDSYIYLHYLCNTPTLSPLYDKDNNLYIFKNIAKNFNYGDKFVKGSNKIILTDMNPVIKILNNYCNNDISRATNLINKYLSSQLSKEKLKIMLKEKSLYSSTVIDSILSEDLCNICKEKHISNNLTVTECGHIFCAECIIKNITYTTKCAICRKSIDIGNIYSLHSSQIFDKYFKIINDIKKDSKTVLYITDSTIFIHLENILEDTDIKYILCDGNSQNKAKIIDKFNNNYYDLFIINIKDYKLSSNIKNIGNIFFAGIDKDILDNQHMYYGYDYINGIIKEINVQYYLYKDSIEHSMLK